MNDDNPSSEIIHISEKSEEDTDSPDEIDDIPDEKVSVYEQGSFFDLCRGPHTESFKKLRSDAFKLTKTAGAYWRGSEKNSRNGFRNNLFKLSRKKNW